MNSSTNLLTLSFWRNFEMLLWLKLPTAADYLTPNRDCSSQPPTRGLVMNLWESGAGGRNSNKNVGQSSRSRGPCSRSLATLRNSGQWRRTSSPTYAHEGAPEDQSEARVHRGTWRGAAVHVSGSRGSRTLLLCQRERRTAAPRPNPDTPRSPNSKTITFRSSGVTITGFEPATTRREGFYDG